MRLRNNKHVGGVNWIGVIIVIGLVFLIYSIVTRFTNGGC